MKSVKQLFTYSFFLLFLTSCDQIFEVDADVQARQALLDLMAIQDKFYQENQRYATGHAEIEKYKDDPFEKDLLNKFDLIAYFKSKSNNTA